LYNFKQMDTFSISQLSQLSGIKPHTIRMWEQRYNALTPYRSEGNTRYYDNTQLRRLLNIASLMESDYKVSELCSMPDKKLFQLVSQSTQNTKLLEGQTGYFISQLIAAGMSYDEAGFDKTFSHCLMRYGLKEAYTKILYPMLVRIGLMWAADAVIPAYEHFISNLVRKKLFTAIDSLPPAKTEASSWLLFLREDEFHEIGLLLSYYLIQLSGQKVIYLGANIPTESLRIAVKQTGATVLLSFFVCHDTTENMQAYLENLSRDFPASKIYISAYPQAIIQARPLKKINWLQSVDDLEYELQENMSK
jgi:MerR family transcriptional regulator, light-induced transcriptional regulator